MLGTYQYGATRIRFTRMNAISGYIFGTNLDGNAVSMRLVDLAQCVDSGAFIRLDRFATLTN